MTATATPPAVQTAPTRAELLVQRRQRMKTSAAQIADAETQAVTLGRRVDWFAAQSAKAAAEFRQASAAVDRLRDEDARQRAAFRERIHLASREEYQAAEALLRDIAAALKKLQLSSYDRADARQRQAAQDRVKLLMDARQSLADVVLEENAREIIAAWRQRLAL